MHKSRARKCRAAVIKRGGYAFARDKIHLPCYAHIERIRKYAILFLRVLALAEVGLELRHKLFGVLRNVGERDAL